MQFSIITIAFNSEKTIERTVKSVLEQTYKDYEYIIVDGGSKDCTLDIVRKYEPLFEGHLKWKSEPDKGIYDAMNKGIARSTGDIVGIVNSDDWLEPDALEKVYLAYQENECSQEDIYTGGMIFHGDNGQQTRLMPSKKMLNYYAKFGDIGGIRHPATFVPNKVYNKIGLFDTRMKVSADADFLLRFYNTGGGYFLIDDILTNMSDGGASNTLTFRHINKNMLPDRHLLMKNLGYGVIRQKVNIVLWLLKSYLKVVLNHLRIYKVR